VNKIGKKAVGIPIPVFFDRAHVQQQACKVVYLKGPSYYSDNMDVLEGLQVATSGMTTPILFNYVVYIYIYTRLQLRISFLAALFRGQSHSVPSKVCNYLPLTPNDIPEKLNIQNTAVKALKLEHAKQFLPFIIDCV
jgi:hypothetical protein